MLDRISFVQINRDSFSHWKTLNISITNIHNTCLISSGAIVSNSSSTNVLLENIADGQFPGAFATTLGSLTLKNITTLSPCQRNTFGGRIGRLSLTSVTFPGVQEGCFQAHQTWDSLEIRSSSLGDIQERGLQGRIGDVRIEQSRLGHIRQHGFDLDVSSLSIHASSIQILAEDALDVRASGVISMQRSNITTVKENAFRLLNSRKTGEGIELSQLAMDTVDNGSLRFSDVNSLALRELQIYSPCGCNIREQVIQLFFGEKPPSTLTKPELARLFQQAYRNIICLHNDTTSSLGDYQCSDCHPQSDTMCNTTTSSAERLETSMPFWIPLGASLGGFLLGAMITLFLVCRYRGHPYRHSNFHLERLQDQPLTETDRCELVALPQEGKQLDVEIDRYGLPKLPTERRQLDTQPPNGRVSADVPSTNEGKSTVNVHVCVNVSESSACSDVCENIPGACADENILGEGASENMDAGEYERMSWVGARGNIPTEGAYANVPRERTYENIPGADRSEEHLYEEISKFRRQKHT